jgi:hypothetical protein
MKGMESAKTSNSTAKHVRVEFGVTCSGVESLALEKALIPELSSAPRGMNISVRKSQKNGEFILIIEGSKLAKARALFNGFSRLVAASIKVQRETR